MSKTHLFAHGHMTSHGDEFNHDPMFYCRKCGLSHTSSFKLCDGLRGGYVEPGTVRELAPEERLPSGVIVPMPEHLTLKGHQRFELVKAALSGALASPLLKADASPEQIADSVVLIADAVMARLGE